MLLLLNKIQMNLKKTLEKLLQLFLLVDLDYKKSIIFNQSAISSHAECSWLLGCFARMGWLNRMTQFKEKAGKDKEKASIGLYIYPVLWLQIFCYMTQHMYQ